MFPFKREMSWLLDHVYSLDGTLAFAFVCMSMMEEFVYILVQETHPDLIALVQ